jgi:RHS repeat-associated protein
MEYEGQDNTKLYKYVWGLDLGSTGVSPDLGQAGGIGGLLAAYDTNGTPGDTGDDLSYIYLYDANGNVGQVIDSAIGDDAATYQYDAYGNLTGASGPFANSNPFRFSTKYYDGETDNPTTTGADGLSHFGYRYYSPRLGRWLSRDPIGEGGGINVYAYVANDPAGGADAMGLFIGWYSQCSERVLDTSYGLESEYAYVNVKLTLPTFKSVEDIFTLIEELTGKSPEVLTTTFPSAWSNIQIKELDILGKFIPCFCVWTKHEKVETTCCVGWSVFGKSWATHKKPKIKTRSIRGAETTYGFVAPSTNGFGACDCPNPKSGISFLPAPRSLGQPIDRPDEIGAP